MLGLSIYLKPRSSQLLKKEMLIWVWVNLIRPKSVTNHYVHSGKNLPPTSIWKGFVRLRKEINDNFLVYEPWNTKIYISTKKAQNNSCPKKKWVHPIKFLTQFSTAQNTVSLIITTNKQLTPVIVSDLSRGKILGAVNEENHYLPSETTSVFLVFYSCDAGMWFLLEP